MRVKLFWKNDPLGPRRKSSFSEENARALESEINAWLRDNSMVKIVEIKQTASGGSYGPSLWLISVWYKEGA
jgi:hypothetical protein